MDQANAVKSPLPTNALHLVDAKAKPFNAAVMQKAMGYTNYLAIHTCPDIVFATNFLSWYFSCPTTNHWKMAKNLLRYIKGTCKLGIELRNCDVPCELTGFADANYAMSTPDKKSTTGYVICFQGSLICWKSKKQPFVAQSTTKAEFIAINVCAKKI